MSVIVYNDKYYDSDYISCDTCAGCEVMAPEDLLDYNDDDYGDGYRGYCVECIEKERW